MKKIKFAIKNKLRALYDRWRWRLYTVIHRADAIGIAVRINLWFSVNWWRLPPTEGWVPGYNCPSLPPCYYKDPTERQPPTVGELAAALAIDIWKVRSCIEYDSCTVIARGVRIISLNTAETA